MQQVEESKFQLEKEMDVKCEEAAKEFERLKLDVESRRQDLEARQKNVEAVVAEVYLLHFSVSVSIISFASPFYFICFPSYCRWIP